MRYTSLKQKRNNYLPLLRVLAPELLVIPQMTFPSTRKHQGHLAHNKYPRCSVFPPICLARSRGNGKAGPLYPLTEIVRIRDPFVQATVWDSIPWLAICTGRVVSAEVIQDLVMDNI